MDIRRVILFSAVAMIGYYLWNAWQQDYPPVIHPTSTVAQQNNDKGLLLPTMTEASTSVSLDPEATENTPKPTQVIRVLTDVLDLSIDLQQGNVVSAKLLNYPETAVDKNSPFVLLQDQAGQQYVANSSLFVVNNNSIKTLDLDYSSPQTDYRLAEDQDELIVNLTGKTADGLDVTKSFQFKKGSYLIDLSYRIANQGTNPWKGYLNTQLLRTSPKEDKSSVFHVGSFTGASYSQPGQHRFSKISFKDMSKSNLDVSSNGGWIAMQQHYFLSAWIPNSDSTNRFYTRAVDGDYSIGVVSQALVVAPQQQDQVSSKLYLGPEITEVLKGIAPGLDLTVDYGWLWFLSSFLFSFMKAIYSVLGNWGWSSVLVTLLIKLAFYRLSATSYKSMAGMRKLQPKLQALRERYGDDKTKISQATMELYRQEKVNPLGGCLPILVQIPVFIALYWVLLESVELRQAPFMLWIKDLAAADPWHVLPVIMGGTMLIQQKLNPAPPDPMQAKIMMFLPVLFTGLFWNFPAGLVLYWIVNNSLSILQQWYITRKYDEQPAKKWAVVK